MTNRKFARHACVVHAIVLYISLMLGACSDRNAGSQPDDIVDGAMPPADAAAQPVDPDPCGLHSGQPDDGRCLPGATLHYGPSSYDDPAAMAPYMLAPGAESVVCAVLETSHPQTFVSAYEASRRDGMHHFTLFQGATAPVGVISCTMATNAMALLQRPHEIETMGDGAPEYEGAALQIPAGSWITQAHAINQGDAPMLVEGWVNLTTVPSTKIPLS
jgi:hypothetical protein